MSKKTVKDIAVNGKRVFVRVDFNVPTDEEARVITDDSRIRAALPTIQYLIEHQAMVVLGSHLGRPDGKEDDKLRMTVVGESLSQLLGQPVQVTRDCIGNEVERVVAGLRPGDVVLLENLRFHPEEESGDPEFARALARLADVFVNDAFGTAHRKHASIVGITNWLPAVSGFLMERELTMLGGLLQKPAHPFTALLGGAKVSDKVNMINNIMDVVDFVLIGGGMAATFLKARGIEVGMSLIEKERLGTAVDLMAKAVRSNVRLILPTDVVVADNISDSATVDMVSVAAIGADKKIVDIGPQTIRDYSDELRRCKTIFWNGTMGIHEIPLFAEGTRSMATAMADSNAATIIGGGSTSEAVTNMGLAEKITFISTGGGAALRLLGDEALPGVDVLLDKPPDVA